MILFFIIVYILNVVILDADSSKQRTRLRRKITAEKTKLSSCVQQYNEGKAR